MAKKMPQSEVSQRTSQAGLNRKIMYATVISLIVGLFLIKNFFDIIAVTLIFAFLFNPLYQRFKLRHKPSIAATYTLLINTLFIVVPIAVIIMITISQSSKMINDIGEYFAGSDLNDILQGILNPINEFVSNVFGIPSALTVDDISEKLSSLASALVSSMLGIIQGFISNIGPILTNVVLYVYIFTAVLIHQEKLLSVVKTLNPLGADIGELYLQKMGAMTRGMVKGQFIIAACQGITSAVVLTLVGVPYGAFFALLLSFLCLVPLGSGVVAIPIGILLILSGNWWQGLVVIANDILIVANIDSVLRPRLVPKEAMINSALLMLSLFSGLVVFGFLGIIIGPVLMIIILTTLDIYQKTNNADLRKRVVPVELSGTTRRG